MGASMTEHRQNTASNNNLRTVSGIMLVKQDFHISSSTVQHFVALKNHSWILGPVEHYAVLCGVGLWKEMVAIQGDHMN